MYVLVCFSWIFFRAKTLQDAIYIIQSATTGLKHFLLPEYIWATLSQLFITNKLEIIITLSLLAIAIGTEMHSINIAKFPRPVRFCIYIGMVFMILQLRIANIKPFIYVRF
jgi:MFS superfamily sulfate permease-like transporter